MNRINSIQNAILELDGGSFQKLLDAYLYKKYNFDNIHPLGSQTATNKVTKGTPDSFVEGKDGKYILIMYGAVETTAFSKIKKDILSCFEKDKLELEKEKIKRIICVYTSTNIHIEQLEQLKNLVSGVEIELLGLGTISHDLLIHYPVLAKEYLEIPIDTEQILTISDFVDRYDRNGMNAPLEIKFMHRETESLRLYDTIIDSNITLLSGNSGVGKTRLAIETCKKFETEGYKVWCVKNNGLALFDDIRFYLSESRKYLLFIDDANQTSNLEYILDYIINSSKNTSIKVLMTVRDYAKKQVEMIVKKYFSIEENIIDPFTTDEIEAILKNNLGIGNSDYLDRITKVAKGNARLAILAGYFAKQKGFNGIKSATDVFRNYYGEIIYSQKLNKQDIGVLFTLSLLGTVSVDINNEFAIKTLKYFGIDALSFLNICHRLNEMELVDLYQNQIAKISDQSFGNYILGYVLLERKDISIQKLLDYGFPKYQNKLIYALNTLGYLFPDDNNIKYVEEQINESWEQADSDIQNTYLRCFHNLNEEKALKLIKNEIDSMESVSKNLKQFDFEAARENIDEENEYLDMLGDFKNSEYLEEAISLLFNAFVKRPDMVMNFYSVFTGKLSFDLDSYKDDYRTEYMLISSLWELSQEKNENENFKILFVQILKSILNCSIQKVMPGDNSGAVRIVTFSIMDTRGARQLRKLIWEILSSLYQYDFLEKEIHIILGEFHGNNLDENQFASIFEFDLECIKRYFIDGWKTPSFRQFLVMKKIVDTAKRLDVKYDESYSQYEQDSDFMVYSIISKESLGESWKEIEEKNFAAVIDMIKDYSIEDFSLFFKLCKQFEERESDGRKNWIIGNNIAHIFDTIRDSVDYVEILQEYLCNKAPYAPNVYHSILNNLVKKIGVMEAIALIDQYEFIDKKNWLGKIWEYEQIEKIDLKIKKEMVNFFISQKENVNLSVPDILGLSHYFVSEQYLVQRVSEWVIDKGRKDSNIIAIFLGRINDEERTTEILEMFEGNIGLLEQLYLLNVYNTYFDYSGILLEALIRKNIEFWNEYTKQISGSKRIESNSEIFKKVWHFENYEEYVLIAYNNFMLPNFRYVREGIKESLFLKDKNSDSTIKRRQGLWVKGYIYDNYENIQRMKKVFWIVQAHFSNKVDYYLEFLKYSKDINFFKSLPLSAASYTWSGSKVPLIDKRIEFIDDLTNRIKGVEFIDHKAYLKEYKKKLEQVRRKIQIEEYTDEYDWM